jgi:hypothetical protein
MAELRSGALFGWLDLPVEISFLVQRSTPPPNQRHSEQILRLRTAGNQAVMVTCRKRPTSDRFLHVPPEPKTRTENRAQTVW